MRSGGGVVLERNGYMSKTVFDTLGTFEGNYHGYRFVRFPQN